MSPGPVTVVATQWTLIFVATIVIGARFYLRLQIQKRRLLGSDILMCAAWITSISLACFDIIWAQRGALDPHISVSFENYDKSPEDLQFLLKTLWFNCLPFFTAFYLCKAALLAVYLQVIPPFMVKRRMLLYATIAFTILSYIATILTWLCICLPVERNWTLNFENRCPFYAGLTMFQITWALHFASDLIVFVLPWTIVPELKLKTSLRIGVYFTFMLGIITITFCLFRFIKIQTASEDSHISLSDIELWSAIDVYVGLIVACLPSLRPYFRPDKSSQYESSTTQSGLAKRKVSEMDSAGSMLRRENEFGSMDEGANYSQSEGGQGGRQDWELHEVPIRSPV